MATSTTGATGVAKNERGSRLNTMERMRIGLYVVQLVCLLLIAYNPFSIHLSTLGLLGVVALATVGQIMIDRNNRISARTAAASPAPDERDRRTAPERPVDKTRI